MVGATRLRNALLLLVLVLAASTATACSDSDAADEEGDGQDLAVPESDGPRFITPKVGDEVGQTFPVEIDFGPIDPSGDTVTADAGGEFHILVDQGCLDNGEAFPEESDTHFVLPTGETTTELELEPGAHELCLQFGNIFDIAFYATDSVTIAVS